MKVTIQPMKTDLEPEEDQESLGHSSDYKFLMPLCFCTVAKKSPYRRPWRHSYRRNQAERRGEQQ